MPCSAIFKTSPTDRGMCCTFNLDSANKMFADGHFTRAVERLQKRDMNLSYSDVEIPPYWGKEEPLPQAGMGLKVVLDAHTDKVMPHSINTDRHWFIATVGPGYEYPLTNQKSVLLRPGHENRQATISPFSNFSVGRNTCLFVLFKNISQRPD